MINIKRLFIVTLTCLFFCLQGVFSQKINQLDDNGLKIGIWKKYYENGKLRYSGEFKDGKEVGVFMFYKNSSSNFPDIVKEYSTVSDTATVKFFNHLGDLKTHGKMIGKKRVGAWKYFYTNGDVFSEEYYMDGKLDGEVKNYYSNGKVTEISQYKNGLKNGLSKIFTDKGILIEEVYYVDGKLNGEAKYYTLKGVIQEKGIYKDNARFGKWEFYVDGVVGDRPNERKTYLVPKSERE